MDTQAPGRQTRKKRRWVLAVGAGASLLIYLVLALSFKISWDKVDQAWQGSSKGLLFWALMVAIFFCVFVGADKFYRVLSALKPLGFDLSWQDTLRLRLGTGPLRVFLPVDAGELFNVLFFWRHKKVPVDLASGAVIFDKGVNLLGATFWLVVGLVLMETRSMETRFPAILLLGAVYGLFFFAVSLHKPLILLAGRINKKFGLFVSGTLKPLGHCTARQKLFFSAYGVFYRINPLLVYYLLFRAFGLTPELGPFLALTSVALFAGHIPTAAGMGPREAVIMVSFSNLAPPSVLLTIGFLQSLFIQIIPLFAGFPWLLWYLRRTALEGERL